jgi:hypothetical protein
MAPQGEKMPQTLDYALGGLDARVTLLERGMKDLQREIRDELHAISVKNDNQNEKIDKLTQAMVSTRSSWKTIGWFVGILAAASTVLSVMYQIGAIR